MKKRQHNYNCPATVYIWDYCDDLVQPLIYPTTYVSFEMTQIKMSPWESGKESAGH